MVLFEIQSRIEAPTGDVFHVSPLQWRQGLRSKTISRYDLTNKTPGVVPVSPFQLVLYEAPQLVLDDLVSRPFDVYIPAKTFYAIAVGIDLSDLGYNEGERVQGLFLQDADDDETQFDPTVIVGLPAIEEGAKKMNFPSRFRHSIAIAMMWSVLIFWASLNITIAADSLTTEEKSSAPKPTDAQLAFFETKFDRCWLSIALSATTKTNNPVTCDLIHLATCCSAVSPARRLFPVT